MGDSLSKFWLSARSIGQLPRRANGVFPAWRLADSWPKNSPLVSSIPKTGKSQYPSLKALSYSGKGWAFCSFQASSDRGGLPTLGYTVKMIHKVNHHRLWKSPVASVLFTLRTWDQFSPGRYLDYSFWGILKQRTQLSHTRIPDPQKPWDNKCYFKAFHFGVIFSQLWKQIHVSSISCSTTNGAQRYLTFWSFQQCPLLKREPRQDLRMPASKLSLEGMPIYRTNATCGT